MPESGMRKTDPAFACFTLSIFLVLVGCAGTQDKPATTATLPSSSISVVSVPRGISGLELGMTPEQIRQSFKITQDEDPVATLLTKYGKPEEGKALSRVDQALQKRFFRISADAGKPPEGVTSADARASHDIIYQIGLHYDEASVKRMGWEGVTYPYLAKYGKPSEDTGSGYVWTDSRTRLEIQSSGSIINIFFTDKALEAEVGRAEREHR
jgi:hypothetical protein